MARPRHRSHLTALVGAALVLAACGGGGVATTRSERDRPARSDAGSRSSSPSTSPSTAPSTAPSTSASTSASTSPPTLPLPAPSPSSPSPSSPGPSPDDATPQPSLAPVTIAPTDPPADPPATASPPPAPAPAPATPTFDAVRLRPHTFVDPQAGGVGAVSVLVPDGWQANGGIQWLPFWSRLAFVQTHVSDPATGITIDWLPIQDFIWFQPPAGAEVPIGGNYQGKAFVPPITDPLELVQRFWVPGDLAELASATVASIVELPIVAQELLTGFGGPGDARAYRIRYEYERDGVPWERDVAFAQLVSSSNGITSWYVNFAWTTAGPAGSLDAAAGLVSAVLASRTTTPEWEATYRLVQRLFYQGIQQQMADTVAFGRLLAQHRAESQALQAEVTAERWASQDRRAEIVRQTLGGVQTYVNPIDGALVQLPYGWDDYWVNTAGEYIAVTDGFDPATLDGGGWQQLFPQA